MNAGGEEFFQAKGFIDAARRHFQAQRLGMIDFGPSQIELGQEWIERVSNTESWNTVHHTWDRCGLPKFSYTSNLSNRNPHSVAAMAFHVFQAHRRLQHARRLLRPHG